MKNYKNFRRLYENTSIITDAKQNHPEKEDILKPEVENTTQDQVETPTFTQAIEPMQEPMTDTHMMPQVDPVMPMDHSAPEPVQPFGDTSLVGSEEKDIHTVQVSDLLAAINLVDPLVKMGIEAFIENNKMALTNNLNQTSANVPAISHSDDTDLNFSTAVQDQPELNFPAN